MSSDFLLGSYSATMAWMRRTVDSQCQAFQLAIDVVGRPGNVLIMNVLQGGPLRFGELAQRCNGPGDKILAARLKELEVGGLLVRTVEPGPPVRVNYRLTEKGQSFGPVAKALERWGRTLASGG